MCIYIHVYILNIFAAVIKYMLEYEEHKNNPLRLQELNTYNKHTGLWLKRGRAR